MHICLPDTQILTIIFVHKLFSQNKVFKVCLCLCLVLQLLFCCFSWSIAASSTSLWLLILSRVTHDQVVFGLPAGFCLPVVIFQKCDYFPLQSSNLSLSSRKRCSNFWTHETWLIYIVCHTHPIQTTSLF